MYSWQQRHQRPSTSYRRCILLRYTQAQSTWVGGSQAYYCTREQNEESKRKTPDSTRSPTNRKNDHFQDTVKLQDEGGHRGGLNPYDGLTLANGRPDDFFTSADIFGDVNLRGFTCAMAQNQLVVCFTALGIHHINIGFASTTSMISYDL